MSRVRRWKQGVGLALGLALALVGRPLLVRADAGAAAASASSAPAPLTQPQETWDPALLRQAGLNPAALHCNQLVSWGPDLQAQAQEVADQIQAQLPHGALATAEARSHFHDRVTDILFWRLVRTLIIDAEQHNAGVIALRGYHWTDSSGVRHPVLVFRSAIVNNGGGGPSCSLSLLESGAVRHVVNLYDADKIPVGAIIDREQAMAKSCGATYFSPDEAERRYGSWRNQLRQAPEASADYRRAMQSLARLIREQILAPGGQPPQGNIYLHCGGGMHRSGIVMGILDRCINQESLQVVEKRYRFHTAWRSAAEPGGAEAGNLQVIKNFDCQSLRLPARGS